MNRIYKVVLNKALGIFVVTSENSKGHTKSSQSKTTKLSAPLVAVALASTVMSSMASANIVLPISPTTPPQTSGISQSIVVGNGTTVNADTPNEANQVIVIGNNQKLEDIANSVFIGSRNETGVNTPNIALNFANSNVLGSNNRVDSANSSILGSNNTHNNPNLADISSHSLMLGTLNTINGGNSIVSGYGVTSSGYSNIVSSTAAKINLLEIVNSAPISQELKDILINGENLLISPELAAQYPEESAAFRAYLLEQLTEATKKSVVEGDYNVASGFAATITGDSTVSLGKLVTIDADQAVAIGEKASVTHDGSVAIGANSKADGATLGQEAYLVGGTATGEFNIGDRRVTGVAAGSLGTDAVNVDQLKALADTTIKKDYIVGDNNDAPDASLVSGIGYTYIHNSEVSLTANQFTGYGNDNKVDVMASGALFGNANSVEESKYATVVGNLNYLEDSEQANVFGNKNFVKGVNSGAITVAVGDANKVFDGGVVVGSSSLSFDTGVAVGRANSAGVFSTAVGAATHANNTSTSVGTFTTSDNGSVSVGTFASSFNGGVAIGGTTSSSSLTPEIEQQIANEIQNNPRYLELLEESRGLFPSTSDNAKELAQIQSEIAQIQYQTYAKYLGTYAVADAVAIGNGKALSEHSIAIGTNAETTTESSIAIGKDAQVTAENSVAIGSGSIADGATLGQEAYLVGGTATGEFNVGDRRITGVAAGSADTDAVNVAQLKSLDIGSLTQDSWHFIAGKNNTSDAAAIEESRTATNIIGANNTETDTLLLTPLDSSHTNILGYNNNVDKSSSVSVIGERNKLTSQGDTQVIGSNNTLSNNSPPVQTGNFNSVLGANNNLQNIAGAIVIGSANKVGNDQAITLGSTVIGTGLTVNSQTSTAFGFNSTVNGSNNISFNSQDSLKSLIIERDKVVNNPDLVAAFDEYIDLTTQLVKNEISQQEYNDRLIAFAQNPYLIDIINSQTPYLIGDKKPLVDGLNNTVFGTNQVIKGDDNIAIGSSTNFEGNDRIAIGSNAQVATDGSIALGSGSNADGTTLGQQAYLVGGTATSEVNIGDRRLTGIAAGAVGTDAVNVDQLTALADSTLQKGYIVGENNQIPSSATAYDDFNYAISLRPKLETQHFTGFGNDNAVDDMGAGVLVGSGNSVKDAENAKIYGNLNYIEDSENLNLYGSKSIISNAKDAVVLGYNNKVYDNNSVSLTVGRANESSGSAITVGVQNSSVGGVGLGQGTVSSFLSTSVGSIVSSEQGSVSVGTYISSLKGGTAISGFDINDVTPEELEEANALGTAYLANNPRYNEILEQLQSLQQNSNPDDAIESSKEFLILQNEAKQLALAAATQYIGTYAAENAVAIGQGKALAEYSIAIGKNAKTVTESSVAIGKDAQVTAENSVAIGSGSIADGATLDQEAYAVGGTATGEVNIGDRRVTGVAAGAVGTDAVNVSQLTQVNDTLTTAIDTTNDNLEILAGRVTTNEGDIAALDGRVTDNEGAITSLDGRVTTNEGDIAALDDRLGTAEGTLANQQSTIGNLQTVTSNLQVGQDRLNNRVDEVEDDLDDLTGRVATNEGDIAALDGRVTDNEGAINALDGRVTENEGAINALDSRVTENEGAINALDSRVTENEGAINALDSRVTENEGAISDLQAGQNNLNDRIDGVEQDLEQAVINLTQADAEVLAAAQADATEKANAAEQAAKDHSDANDAITLAAAKADATEKANAAEQAAKDHSDANDAITLAAAKADATEKANAAEQAAKDHSDANDAITLAAAKADATEKANAAEKNANIYTDGKVKESLDLSYAYTDKSKQESFNYTDVKVGEGLKEAKDYADKGDAATYQASKEYTDYRVNALENSFRRNDSQNRAGIAGAMALAALPQALPDSRGALTMAGGTYRGESAFALGASTVLPLDENKYLKSITFKAGFTTDSRSNSGGNLGVGFNF